MFPEASCLILLHVDFSWLFAFGHKVCEPEGRAFSDETTFRFALGGRRRLFDLGHPAGVAGKIRCRADLRLSGSPP